MVNFKPNNENFKNHQWFQIGAILIACMTALNFGLCFAWPSPSITILTSPQSPIKMDLVECSYFTIIQSVALMITCPILAVIVDVIGRKMCVLFLSIPYGISWILIATAHSKTMLYVSRIFVGIGDAGVFTVLPMYVAEISEPKVRGIWGNMVGLGIYFGQFAINIIGAYASMTTTAIIGASISLIHFILFVFMPESPYFYLMKGRNKEATKSLQILRWRSDVEEELDSIECAVKRQISEEKTIWDLFADPVNRKALIIAGGLRLSQQFCGMPAFGVYTRYFFKKSKSSIKEPINAIVYTGALLIIMATNMFLMDRYGRKRSMIISSIGCGTTLFCISLYFMIDQFEWLDVSCFQWFPLFGMIIWLLFAGSGLGLVPLLMLGELFSASVKGKAICVVCVVFSIGFMSATKIFIFLADNVGIFCPFIFFGLCSVAIFVFSYFYVPETKGKTLEEIQLMLKKRRQSMNK